MDGQWSALTEHAAYARCQRPGCLCQVYVQDDLSDLGDTPVFGAAIERRCMNAPPGVVG